jgi:hypothetical protein
MRSSRTAPPHRRGRGLRLLADAGDPEEASAVGQAEHQALLATAEARIRRRAALRAHVREVLQGEDPLTYEGFGAFLDRVLPAHPDAQAQLAADVYLTPAQLVHLRFGLADPLTLPPLGVLRLADAAALSWAQLETLVLRDHGHHAPSTSGDTPHQRAAWADAALDALRTTRRRVYGPLRDEAAEQPSASL